MKITGIVTFQPLAQTGTEAHWDGGRFGSLPADVINGLPTAKERVLARCGQPFELGLMKFRVICPMVSSGNGHNERYIVMRDGLLARLVRWYYWKTHLTANDWCVKHRLPDIPKWTWLWLVTWPVVIRK